MSALERRSSLDSSLIRRTTSAVQRPRTTSARPFTSSRSRRPYSAYTKRGTEEQATRFDAPETNREWWRHYVKETPVPGAYQHKGFVDDLQDQTATYRFRDSGRRPTSARFHSAGEVLLPGAYEQRNFLEEIGSRPATYNFRGLDRGSGPKIGHGHGDKELDTSPAWYDLRIIEDSQIEREKNLKDSNYKSRVVRKLEGNHQFSIVQGPGPGLYDDKNTTRPSSATIKSVFVSKVPRFSGRGSRVPGPGAYNISTSGFGDPKPLPAVSYHLKKKTGIAAT